MSRCLNGLGATPAKASWQEIRALYEMARDDANAPHEGDLSDQECELLADAESAACKALLLTPAPNLAAVAYKLEVFAAQDCFGMSDECRDPLFSALLADVRRLGGGEEQ